MNRKRLVLASLTSLCLVVSSSSTVLAHHSVAATYLRDVISIEGTLKEFLWRNPHSFMKVEAPDKQGQPQIWVVEGAAPQQLTEAGLRTNTFRPGDHIIVTGQVGRLAEDHRMLLHTITRPSDGVKWEAPAAQN